MKEETSQNSVNNVINTTLGKNLKWDKISQRSG